MTPYQNSIVNSPMPFGWDDIKTIVNYYAPYGLLWLVDQSVYAPLIPTWMYVFSVALIVLSVTISCFATAMCYTMKHIFHRLKTLTLDVFPEETRVSSKAAMIDAIKSIFTVMRPDSFRTYFFFFCDVLITMMLFHSSNRYLWGIATINVISKVVGYYMIYDLRSHFMKYVLELEDSLGAPSDVNIDDLADKLFHG